MCRIPDTAVPSRSLTKLRQDVDAAMARALERTKQIEEEKKVKQEVSEQPANVGAMLRTVAEQFNAAKGMFQHFLEQQEVKFQQFIERQEEFIERQEAEMTNLQQVTLLFLGGFEACFTGISR